MTYLIAALVIGPKNPTAGVIFMAFWNFMTAARVAGPKRLVSLPFEPAPLTETIKPLALRYCWSAFTSKPDMPAERDLENEPEVIDVDTPPAADCPAEVPGELMNGRSDDGIPDEPEDDDPPEYPPE